MTWWALRLCVMIWLLIVLSSCKHSTEPLVQLPDTTSHSISWRTDSLGYYSSSLLDVWGVSPVSVYAVGRVNGEPPEPGTYLTHFDGVSWTLMKDDSLLWWIGGGVLAGIHGLTDTSIFVVGSRASGPPPTGFAGRWSKKGWVNISPDSTAPLLSVWVRSMNDVYASGARGTILHYDGRTWQSLQSGTSLDVWQITGLPTGEIYAVASDYFNSYVGSAVLRISGNTVTQEHFFPIGRLFGIHGFASSSLYVTGEDVYRRAGAGSWEVISTPSPFVNLRSVSATEDDNIIIAGVFGAVLHWSGASWKFYDELYDRSSSKAYFRAFAIGNKYFLVGNTPSHAMITVGTRSAP
jgi:hypothetical protein